jgi:cysteine-rich repeat protein
VFTKKTKSTHENSTTTLHRATVATVVSLIASFTACRIDGEFACTSDSQCVLGGLQGSCDVGAAACTFPDDTCTSGWRYGSYTSPVLRNQCATPITSLPTAGPLGSTCGNGTVESPEDCDDGNEDDTDGCTTSCLGTTYLSCRELITAHPGLTSGLYYLDTRDPAAPSLPPYRAYCDMTPGNSGGWTLVLKADGRNTTFDDDSTYWTDSLLLNPEAPDLDQTEAKLRSFVTVPFSELRVGLVAPGGAASQIRWLTLPVSGTSLLAALQNNTYVPPTTSLGRAAWMALIDTPTPQLQPNCNREGLNVGSSPAVIEVRIGIMANNENQCDSPDSWIGIGGSGNNCTLDTTTTVGNSATCLSSERDTKLFGYVMAR